LTLLIKKHESLKCVEDIIKKWSIPVELVIHFDQTNVSIIQVTNLLYDKNWTKIYTLNYGVGVKQQSIN
jgi:hypothetical protein